MIYSSSKAKQDSLISWMIVLAAAGFFFCDFVQMAMMNTLKDDFVKSLGIAEGTTVSYVNVAFSLANWIWVFPAALLIDRFSVRKMTLAMLAVSILGAFGTAWSHQPYLVVLCRFASGTAHAFCFLCCTTLVRRWFSPAKRATVLTLVVAIGVSGLLAAQYPLDSLKNLYGWRIALSVNATIALICWFVSLLFVQDYPADVAPPKQLPRPLAGLTTAMRNPQIWLYSLYTACLNAPIPAIVFAYLNDFLKDVHQVTSPSFMATLFMLGHVLGISFAGWMSEQWQSRQKPLIYASALSSVLFALFLFYAPLPQWLIAPLLFALGLLLGGQTISYPAIGELSDPRLAATSMSIASFVIMGSFPFFEKLTIRLVAYAKAQEGATPFATYAQAFTPVFIALLISLALSFVVQETYGKTPPTPSPTSTKSS